VAVFLYQDDPNWQSTCIRIIEFFSAAWGGGYNIIVPTDGKTIPQPFWQILDIYDADYFFFYYHTGKDVSLNEPAKYAQWVERELEHYVNTGPVSDIDSARRQIDEQLIRSQLVSEPSAELRLQLIRRFAPFHFEDHAFEQGIGAGSVPHFPLAPLMKLLPNLDHQTRIVMYESRFGGLYPLWLASVTGSLTEEMRADFNSIGIVTEMTSADYASIDFFVSPAEGMRRAQYQLTTPFELSNIDTGLYRPVKAMVGNEQIVLVLGDTLADFCLYYSLSRLKNSVTWLPLTFLKSQSETGGQRTLLDGYIDHLKGSARTARNRRDPRYALVSASADKNDFDSAIEALDQAGYVRSDRIGESVTISPDLRTLVQHPLRLYERDNVFRPSALAISETAELDFFETPKPKNFNRIDPYENRWITEINIPAHQLPRNRHIGQWVVRHPTSASNTARVAKSGISYFCPNSAYFGGDIDTSLVRPTVHIPDAFQTFEYLFDREGYRASTSDKGFFARDTVQKFGNLSTVGSLLRPTAMRGMLLKFLDHIKPAQGVHDEGVVLNDKRRYLNLPTISKYLGTDKAAQAAIELLLTAQVLQRGFIFKCRFCRNADWFSLDEVTQNFKCKRCARIQGVSAQNYWYGEHEPGWFYKLDEIVYQFLRHNGYVTLLALDYLKRKANDSFLYTPDLELTKDGENDAFMELDILCLPDGAMSIGEAKKEDRLGNSKREEIETVRTYNRLAKQIGAESLVFATFAESWSDKTEAYITDNVIDCNVILLTRSELVDENP
jgi:hypothetical protein